MPQCMDPNCACNRPLPTPPRKPEPVSTEEIRDEIKSLILKLGDDIEYANYDGVMATMDALDIVSATITEVREKIYTEEPWTKPTGE